MKIRIYKLAKELKVDSKKILEEARRLGLEVHIPSHTIAPEIAESIRKKFGKARMNT